MNIFGLNIDYIATISDTYTVIVGFVAIGIPLALQIARVDSEKYSSRLLAKRLTTGRIVNPVSLVCLSVTYILLSFILKLTKSTENTYFNNDNYYLFNELQDVFTIALFIAFILTTIASGWFYIRFYFRVTTTSDSYISHLLLRKRSYFDRLIEKVPSLLITKSFTEKKYNKNDIKHLEAGLEALVEQFKNKNWDVVYKEILFNFHKELIQLCFGAYKNPKTNISDIDIIIIKLYWNSLIKVVKISRNNYDSTMSFHSQRLLFSLIGEFIHHPNNVQIVTSEFPHEKTKKIYWTGDIYELSRWQSQQVSDGIDLILECEWVSELCGTLKEASFKYSGNGTIQAFKLLFDILHLVASKQPNKISKIYSNISENLPSFHGDNRQTYWFADDIKWTNSFWMDFYNSKFDLLDFDSITKKLESLENGEAYIKYGTYGKSRLLTEKEIIESNKQPEWDELYKKSYLNYCEYIALKFVAVLAFYNLWQELFDCLEWKKPKGSNINFVGNVLLPDTPENLGKAILNNDQLISNDFWFIDRHNIEPYVYQGLSFILIDFFDRNKSLPTPLISSSKKNIRNRINVIEKLDTQLSHLTENGIYEQGHIDSVDAVLKDSLDYLKEQDIELKKSYQPSTEQKLAFFSALEEGWRKGLSNNKSYNIDKLFRVKYSDNIQPYNMKLIKQEFTKLSFSDSNLEVFGEISFDRTFNNIYSKLLESADECTVDNIDASRKLLFLAEEENLEKLGFSYNKSKRRPWMHSENDSWTGILTSNKKILIVDQESIEIIFTRNCIFTGQANPLFHFFMDEDQNLMELRIDAYFNIKFLNEKSCLIAI